MKRILFINPWNYHEENKKYYPEQLQYIWRDPPYGIVSLATLLQKEGYDVLIADLERDLVIKEGKLENVLKDLEELIIDFQPYLIGLTILSVRYPEARKIIKLCDKIRKARGLSFKIIVGNIHPTAEPKRTLMENPEVDLVFIGEAEKALLDYLKGKPLHLIKGIAYRGGSQINVSSPEVVKEIDTLPFPNWNLIDVEFYTFPNYVKHQRKNKPSRSLDVIMHRGCPYRCNFCAYNLIPPRWHSPNYVIKNIRYLIENYPIDSIYFLDSSIGNSRRYLYELCERLIKSGLNREITWSANMRPDQVDEELLKLLWKAGCRQLFYGFESASQKVLDRMNKKIRVEDNERVVKLHRKLGFPYHASFLIGYIGENEKDIEITIKWIEKNRPPRIGINTFIPLPGCRDYEYLKQQGKLEVENPNIWRLIGEVNNPDTPIFCDVPKEKFMKYLRELQLLEKELAEESNYFEGPLEGVRMFYRCYNLASRRKNKIKSFFYVLFHFIKHLFLPKWRWM